MSNAAKYGDPLIRPRRAQLAATKAEFLDPGRDMWQTGFCQALLSSTWENAGAIPAEYWDDQVVPSWLAYPWLTFVVGSGALSVPAGFAQRVRQLPGQFQQLAETILAKDEWPQGKPRTLEVGMRISDAQEFIDELLGARLDPRVDSVPEPDGEDDAETPTISEFTTALILAVSTLTRTYHELSIVLNTPLDRWGRDVAKAGPSKPSERRRVKRDWTDVSAFLGYLRQALEADRDEWLAQEQISDEVREKPFETGEAGSLQALLNEIETKFKDEVTIEAEHVRMLTALVWHRLLKELSPTHYPGWTDLLMRLVLQNERAQLSHRQPRWKSLVELNNWVAETIVPAAGSTWRVTPETTPITLDPEVQGFYDAMGKTLWAQSRVAAGYGQRQPETSIMHDGVAYEAMRLPHRLPLATAYVTSFDMELERSLWRTLDPRVTPGGGTFSIVFPAYLQSSPNAQDGEFYWLEKIVTVDTARDPDGLFWFRDTTNRGEGPQPRPKIRIMHTRRTDVLGHPYVVRLGGCPVINVPRLSELMEDADFARDYKELNDNPAPSSGVFVHSLTVDEFLSLRQVETEQVWRTMKDQQSRTLPEPMRLSEIDGPTRCWALLGIQLRDPAVRVRLLSLFNHKFSQQSSPTPRAPIDDTDDLLVDESDLLPAEEVNVSALQENPVARQQPGPTKLCGFAVNVAYGDDELVLIDSLNLTSIEGRAQALSPEIEHYAQHFQDYLAAQQTGSAWHRPSWAGCEVEHGGDLR